jgi:hypothetical protein
MPDVPSDRAGEGRDEPECCCHSDADESEFAAWSQQQTGFDSKVIGNTRELRGNWPMLAIKVKSGERPSVLGINVLMKLQMNLQM